MTWDFDQPAGEPEAYDWAEEARCLALAARRRRKPCRAYPYSEERRAVRRLLLVSDFRSRFFRSFAEQVRRQAFHPCGKVRLVKNRFRIGRWKFCSKTYDLAKPEGMKMASQLSLFHTPPEARVSDHWGREVGLLCSIAWSRRKTCIAPIQTLRSAVRFGTSLLISDHRSDFYQSLAAQVRRWLSGRSGEAGLSRASFAQADDLPAPAQVRNTTEEPEMIVLVAMIYAASLGASMAVVLVARWVEASAAISTT